MSIPLKESLASLGESKIPSSEGKDIKSTNLKSIKNRFFLVKKLEIQVLITSGEANEVPISSHIWVASSTFRQI